MLSANVYFSCSRDQEITYPQSCSTEIPSVKPDQMVHFHSQPLLFSGRCYRYVSIMKNVVSPYCWTSRLDVSTAKSTEIYLLICNRAFTTSVVWICNKWSISSEIRCNVLYINIKNRSGEQYNIDRLQNMPHLMWTLSFNDTVASLIWTALANPCSIKLKFKLAQSIGKM